MLDLAVLNLPDSPSHPSSINSHYKRGSIEICVNFLPKHTGFLGDLDRHRRNACAQLKIEEEAAVDNRCQDLAKEFIGQMNVRG